MWSLAATQSLDVYVIAVAKLAPIIHSKSVKKVAKALQKQINQHTTFRSLSHAPLDKWRLFYHINRIGS